MLVLLVPALLYVPWVQRTAVHRALAILNDNDQGIEYNIRDLQLRFPLEIELWDVCMWRPASADTLVYVHHIKTALDDWPHGEQSRFVVGGLSIDHVQTGIDTAFVAGLDLRGGLDSLHVSNVALCLDSNRVEVGGVWLHKPQFAVAYTSDTIAEAPADTTESAPWQVRLGTLQIMDLAVAYDKWRVDSLQLELQDFIMLDNLLHLDTLDIRLPHSGIACSGDVQLSDSLYKSVNLNADMLVSRADIIHVAGAAMPELETYLPDSACLRGFLSLYMTPDTMVARPFVLSLPGFLDVYCKANAVYPFDNVRRKADMQLQVSLERVDSLLTALVGNVQQRGYRVPDHMSIMCNATQTGETIDAVLSLSQEEQRDKVQSIRKIPSTKYKVQGTKFQVPSTKGNQKLSATATYNLTTEEYRAALNLMNIRVSDYVPDVQADHITLALDAQGQRFDMADTTMRFAAELRVDTLSYRQESDSTTLLATVHDVRVSADKTGDTLSTHADINFYLEGLGSFDGLKINFLNSPSHMNLHVGTGDALVDADAACDVYQLSDVMGDVLGQLDMQATNKAFDINQLQRLMPQLTISAGMGKRNPIEPLLAQHGVGFDRLQWQLSNSDSLRMKLSVDSLRVEDVRVARVGASLVPHRGDYDYRLNVLYEDTVTGSDFKLAARARLLSDSILTMGTLVADTMPVLSFGGCLSNRIHADVWLASLPLSLVNGFLTDDIRLKGTLEGHAQLDCDSVDFNALRAAVWFDSASVWYEGCDMTIGLPHDSIVYHDGLLTLDHIRFNTANGRPLQIDGKVDMRQHPDNPDINLKITADDAHLISNTKRRSNAQFVCGTLPLSASVDVVGAVNNLKVNGTVTVPRGCDLTYYYEDDGTVSSNSQLNDLVEFVSFAEMDSAITVLRESGQLQMRSRHSSSRLDVNLKLRINPATRITAWLPTSKDDHVMIRGGGDLKMSLDANGDLQLSGGYNVTDGDINFKLPMLPVTKQFALTDGSWLRWSGIFDKPELNFKATEGVKCTINDAVAGARVVKFVVSILIKGTLEDMDIIFDCTAPEDAAIQSELATLTDEERMKQALMLLVAQTYTGPSAMGASAGLSSANAAMSSIINKQLESMLSGKMKHTEINVGIDTYDPNGTGAQQTDYSLSVSQRFLNDRMRVTIGGKMSTGDEVQQSDGAVLSDVSLEWLIKSDASQYARLFRHINYQSILEGQVIESGVGYVQRRNAYKFKHLFIRSRRKRDEARREMIRQMNNNK